jgi:hypothetical protein
MQQQYARPFYASPSSPYDPSPSLITGPLFASLSFVYHGLTVGGLLAHSGHIVHHGPVVHRLIVPLRLVVIRRRILVYLPLSSRLRSRLRSLLPSRLPFRLHSYLCSFLPFYLPSRLFYPTPLPYSNCSSLLIALVYYLCYLCT